jgi:molybdenum cofactor cytidylyltransferase
MSIAGIILAAGKGTRMGGGKMTAKLHGKALVRHVADVAISSNLDQVIAVLGHDAAKVEQALHGTGVRIIHNPDYAEGMATSLKAAISALSEQTKAALILLGDMPQITPKLIQQLIEAFNNNPHASGIVPVVQGKRGNPILIAAALFASIMQLEGDIGARKLLAEADAAVIELDVQDPAILNDIDTTEALEKLNRR